MDTGKILLRPRPYARDAGVLLLLPLLPGRPTIKPLPTEIWSAIFAYALQCSLPDAISADSLRTTGLSLILICKSLKDVALPLIYSDVRISTVLAFKKFTTHLHHSDQRWDSIRRILHSTPGRWVHRLDLSGITHLSLSQSLLLDSLLSQLFPLVPFLTRLILNSSFVPSRLALESLANSEASRNLKTLEGLGAPPSSSLTRTEEPLLRLLNACPNLEELEIVGGASDSFEMDLEIAMPSPDSGDFQTALGLQHLHTLRIVSISSTLLLATLLNSPLSSLRKLTITPYDDIPYPLSLTSAFIQKHGTNLRSLLLVTPNSWPTKRHPSPTTLLQTCPNLRHLSLEHPVPMLSFPDCAISQSHPLEILTIPRPTPSNWKILERLLPRLPMLRAVMSRDVRWLRQGMTVRALEAGVQGEMREWRRRLNLRGIKLLDADGMETYPLSPRSHLTRERNLGL